MNSNVIVQMPNIAAGEPVEVWSDKYGALGVFPNGSTTQVLGLPEDVVVPEPVKEQS